MWAVAAGRGPVVWFPGVRGGTHDPGERSWTERRLLFAGGQLLAAWFVHPALLGGAGLVALPIIIHYLSRRRHRRLEWGAMRFLLQAERESRRRVRFEQWLLLALRCLAMLLLALLVARPFVRPGLVASLLGGRGRVHRIVVLDDSASLAFRAGTQQDFALLRDATTRLLQWIHDGSPGDPVTLIRTSAPERPLADAQTLDVESWGTLRERLARLRVTSRRSDPARVVAAIVRRIDATAPSQRCDVYMFSDFQRSEWLARRDAADTAGESATHAATPAGGWFAPLTRVASGRLRVMLIALGRGPRDNAAIEDIATLRPHTIAGMPAQLRAWVTNYAQRPLKGARLRVAYGKTTLPPVLIEPIEPGARRTVSVELTVPDEGETVVTATLEPADGLVADDVRRVVLPVRAALRVLLVDGQPAGDSMRDEVVFLQAALAPAGPFTSGIHTRRIDPADLPGLDLDTFDCVILANVAPPGVEAVAALRRFVVGGGGLVFFLGSNAGDVAEYNRAFGNGAGGLLPLPLAGVTEVSEDPGVGMVATREHPVTVMFPAVGAQLSEYVHFRTFVRCATPPGTASSPAVDTDAAPVVLARFADATHAPAWIERRCGAGRVLMFTSTADLDWNDWPRAVDGSYVVTMLELVQYAARRAERSSSLVPGQRLAVRIDPEHLRTEGVFRAPPPASIAFPAEVAAGGDSAGGVWLRGPVGETPGVYTLELKRRDGTAEVRPLVVNLDPRESNLAAATRAELDTELAGVPHDYIEAATAFPPGQVRPRQELWPAVLVTLLLLLVVEQTLAWYFGRPQRGAGGTGPRSWWPMRTRRAGR